MRMTVHSFGCTIKEDLQVLPQWLLISDVATTGTTISASYGGDGGGGAGAGGGGAGGGGGGGAG